MEIPIIIQGIECSVHCGVTDEERAHPQPILVDLQLQCPNARAAQTDHLIDTIDYGTLVKRVIELSQKSRFHLLEALADHISQTLFSEFPISHLNVWVRKTAAPLDHIKGSVGVRLSQSRSQATILPRIAQELPEPSAFLLEHYSRFDQGNVLDIAAGSGRHALYLASQGFAVSAIDRNEEALTQMQHTASKLNIPQLHTSCIDLEADPANPPSLGKEEYEGVMVFFYLFRPLFPHIIQALKPGGILLYETFSIDNHLQHNHPRNKDFCLMPNELLELTKGLRILSYHEGQHEGSQGHPPLWTVRLVAKKESLS